MSLRADSTRRGDMLYCMISQTAISLRWMAFHIHTKDENPADGIGDHLAKLDCQRFTIDHLGRLRAVISHARPGELAFLGRKPQGAGNGGGIWYGEETKETPEHGDAASMRICQLS